MVIVCPKCQKQGMVKGGDELIGRKIRCPSCSEIFTITNHQQETTTAKKETDILKLQADKQRIQNLIAQLGHGNLSIRNGALFALKNVNGAIPYLIEALRNKNHIIRSYAILHRAGYYRGETNVDAIKEGIQSARFVIEKLTGKRIG